MDIIKIIIIITIIIVIIIIMTIYIYCLFFYLFIFIEKGSFFIKTSALCPGESHFSSSIKERQTPLFPE